MHLEDVGVEEGPHALAPHIAEEAFDLEGFPPLNDRHVVQLEELDDEADPLQVLSIHVNMLPTALASLFRGGCLPEHLVGRARVLAVQGAAPS